MAVGLLSAGPSASAEPAATGARLSLHAGFTRLEVDLSGPAEIETFFLPNAEQVVVLLPPVDWRLEPRVDTRLGAVDGFAAEPAGAGAWRLVIDVNREVALRKAVVVPVPGGTDYRLVVELADPDLPLPDATAPSVEALVGAANPFLPARLFEPAVIVIDPGHGGRDPGASGFGGAVEKDIVLATALLLRDSLEALGMFKVVLTRQDDRALSLDDRAALAVAVGADLFVSLHADAFRSTVARGVSVYSLSAPESDREAAVLARNDERAGLLADIGYGDTDPAVGDILLDIMMDVTTVDSARLAEIVVDEVGRVARLVDNSHRRAGYHVLKMPHTPAILVELGYLSNAIDATDLQDVAHQQALAGAIAAGIHRYMLLRAPAQAGARLDSAATQTP